MNYYNRLFILSLMIPISTNAYWGQSYVESMLAAIRNYWNKKIQSVFVNPSGLSKKTSAGTADLGSLDLAAYIAYKNQKSKELAKKIAEGQAADSYNSKIIIDPQQNISVSLIKEITGDLIMTIADDEINVEITDSAAIKNMTVDKIKEIAINEKILRNVIFAQDISKTPSATYIRSILIDPSQNIKMFLTKSKGGRLFMAITNGNKEIEMTDVAEMKRMTYARIKQLF